MKARDIIYILVIIAIMSFFMNDCSRDALIERETVTVTDTIYSYHSDTILVPFPVNDTIYKPVYVEVKKPLPQRKDSLRIYTGYYDIEIGKVFWKANVSGFMEEIKFSSDFDVPIINNTKIATVTETKTITKIPRWNLYGGIQGIASDNYFDIVPVADLRIGKIQYGYGYGLVNKTHLIKVSVRIL